MEVWILINGKKLGPYQDYEVRERLERGELTGDEYAWHDGQVEWTPLKVLELFKDSLGKRSDVLPPLLPKEYLSRAEAQKAAARRSGAHLVRRFWARWFDLSIYVAIWWLGMYFAGRDIESVLAGTWVQILKLLPWFIIEAYLIQSWGTTPGKWLLGIAVRNEDSSKLEFKASTWRAMRVLVTGLGFGFSLLVIACQAISWFSARRVGKPLWDFLGGHKLVVEPLNQLRVLVLIAGMSVAILVQALVLWPVIEKSLKKDYPNFPHSLEKVE